MCFRFKILQIETDWLNLKFTFWGNNLKKNLFIGNQNLLRFNNRIELAKTHLGFISIASYVYHDIHFDLFTFH